MMGVKREGTSMNDKPFTVKQLAAAMIALGHYEGKNTDAEHEAEAKRLGGMKAYQMRLANALLGLAETDAMIADSQGVLAEQMDAAHRQALTSAGVEDDPGKLLNFLRWRTLRPKDHGGRLRRIRTLGHCL
jgi:hypothetical protein